MSGFYSEGLEGLLARTIPSEASLNVIGVNADYTYNAGHALSNINPDHILLTEQLLAGESFTDGILNADDIVWFNAQPPESELISPSLIAVVIYFSWNAGADTALLAFIDSVEVGLPMTLVGVNVTAVWHESGILKI